MISSPSKNVTHETCRPISCHVIEKDENEDIIWTWSYPSLSHQERAVCILKCDFVYKASASVQNSKRQFRIFRLKKQWAYIYLNEVFTSDKLKQVKQVAILVTALDFNPERYETLCRIFSKSFCKSGNASVMLQLFLNVCVTGKCATEENGIFYASEFDTHNPYRHHELKGIISKLGLETILIFSALLYRKRIAVYHHNVDSLVQFVLSLPAFLSERVMWNDIYPWTDLIEEEMEYFKNSKFHVIGCMDAGIVSRTELYDIFVNVPAAEITVATHAKDLMAMTKTHKEIALFMVQLAENENLSERDVMQEILKKTKELTDNLRSGTLE